MQPLPRNSHRVESENSVAQGVVIDSRESCFSDRRLQHDAVTTQTHLEHGGLLNLIHQLESKLAAAAPGREREWFGRVLQDLRQLTLDFREHVESAGTSGGLFEEMRTAAPNLLSRVERLQQRQDGLLQQLKSWISQIDNHRKVDVPDFADIRRRTAAAIEEIRSIQAQENDLIFECFHTDLGVGD